MVLVVRCQTLLEDLWTIWSCCLYVFYEHYYHNVFINVYMVLFLFNNVIYVFLLLWLCILTVCLCMTTLTEVFPCFFLSCKASASVKSAKTGHGPHSSQLLCCSMYCLFCVVLRIVCFVTFPCIVCVYMCTEQLPPGGYPVAVKYIIYHFFSYVPLIWSDTNMAVC
jgi:magnesium-transporting ATPase (P-type)